MTNYDGVLPFCSLQAVMRCAVHLTFFGIIRASDLTTTSRDDERARVRAAGWAVGLPRALRPAELGCRGRDPAPRSAAPPPAGPGPRGCLPRPRAGWYPGEPPAHASVLGRTRLSDGDGGMDKGPEAGLQPPCDPASNACRQPASPHGLRQSWASSCRTVILSVASPTPARKCF